MKGVRVVYSGSYPNRLSVVSHIPQYALRYYVYTIPGGGIPVLYKKNTRVFYI